MAWSKSTILSGVYIGDGAIIGANSVVGSNVKACTIAVWNPARIVRKRFDDEFILLLLKLKWWNKSIEEINNIIPFIIQDEYKLFYYKRIGRI